MDSLAIDAAAIDAAEPRVGRGLSPWVMAGIVVLAVSTFLLTWRVSVLEGALEREGEQPELVSKAAPEFSGSTLDGRTVSLADFRGQKKVVIAFWASWCGPCRMEMPSLVQFYKNNHTGASDFEILAVSIDEDPKEAASFATAMQLNFPVVLDGRQKIAGAYGVEGIPTTFIIDKSGKVIYGRSGYDGLSMEFTLARELGISLRKAGADGDSSH